MPGSRKTHASTTAPRPRRILNGPDPTPAVHNESDAATITQAFNEPLIEGQCDPKPGHQPSCTGTPSRPREDLKRTVRRRQLREMVPLADTTIYEMEQRGEFPRRFYLTPRCVGWDASEVESWIEERRRASSAQLIKLAPCPDVRKRSSRPIRR
jgi:prophage regulatory protein